jgi:hypothetical protein
LAYSFLLTVVLLAMALISAKLLASRESLSDRLAEVADVVAGGTAALGVIAGLIAIQAYAAATGLPKLELQVWFTTSEKNRPVFRARKTVGGVFQTSSPPSQTTAIISLRNRSHYSARGVVVILKFSSIFCGTDNEFSDRGDWVVFEFPDGNLGTRELVVQSGVDGIIHGGVSRRLPDLRLGRLSRHQSWPPPRLSAEIIADGGYNRHVDMNIQFMDDDNPEASSEGRAHVREWL